MQNLCVESLFEKLQLHMIMAKKKKKKKKKRSLLACVALVFNKINHWTTGTLCDIMEKKKKHCLKVSVHAFEYCWKVNITNELYLVENCRQHKSRDIIPV